MELKDILKRTHVQIVPLKKTVSTPIKLIEDPYEIVQGIEKLVKDYSRIQYKHLRYVSLENGEFEYSWNAYGKCIRYARALSRPSLIERVSYESGLLISSPLDTAGRIGSSTWYLFERAADHMLHTSQENALCFYSQKKDIDTIMEYIKRCEGIISTIKNPEKVVSVIDKIKVHLLVYEQWREKVQCLIKKDS